MNRLTDNDKTWGPFTVARWSNWIELSFKRSHYCCFTAIAFGLAFRVMLPRIIPVGRYGFTISRQSMKGTFDFLSVYYGMKHDWDTSKSKEWHCHFPWTQWRFQRRSIYRPDGSVLAHFPRTKPGMFSYDEQHKFIDVCPKSVFLLKDHDGTTIRATCYIEEREWSLGEGWFKWLRWFKPNMVHRSLDIAFDQETGTEKGSWKGGTTGTSIEMHQNDTPLDAIKKYCAKEHRAKGRAYTMEFLSEVHDTDQPATTKLT